MIQNTILFWKLEYWHHFRRLHTAYRVRIKSNYNLVLSGENIKVSVGTNFSHLIRNSYQGPTMCCALLIILLPFPHKSLDNKTKSTQDASVLSSVKSLPGKVRENKKLSFSRGCPEYEGGKERESKSNGRGIWPDLIFGQSWIHEVLSLIFRVEG